MIQKTRSTKRIVLLSVVVVFAVVGLTSCDGEADHYYAIFGPTTPAFPGPDCAVYCVATEAQWVGSDFEVDRGDKVRFVNFTWKSVDVTLKYYMPGGTITSDTFTISPGDSKKKKIGQDLTGGVKITVTYRIATTDHGGPGMIVEP